MRINTALTVATCAALTAVGSAETITSEDIPLGVSDYQPAALGYSVFSGNGVFTSEGPFSGLGVSGGFEENQIDRDDVLAFRFDSPATVNSLALGSIFAADETVNATPDLAYVDVFYEDQPDTFERFTIAGGGVLDGFADGVTADVSGAEEGLIEVTSGTADGLFGSNVTGVNLFADAGEGFALNNDFTFLSLGFTSTDLGDGNGGDGDDGNGGNGGDGDNGNGTPPTPTPIPTPTAAILGLGGMAAAAGRRRRQSV